MSTDLADPSVDGTNHFEIAEASGPPGARVDVGLTRSELVTVMNALNEIIEFIDSEEFPLRVGVERDSAEALWERLDALRRSAS